MLQRPLRNDGLIIVRRDADKEDVAVPAIVDPKATVNEIAAFLMQDDETQLRQYREFLDSRSGSKNPS
jgi:hypothetical protein